MSFLKETDYHGSHAYDGEGAARTLVEHFGQRASLTFAWMKLQIESLVRRIAAPTTSSLVDHGEKHFTLLGNKQRVIPVRRPITDIFPIANCNEPPRGD